MIVWYCNLTTTFKGNLDRIVKSGRKTCLTVPVLNDVFDKIVLRKSKKIQMDRKHPLNNLYCLLPSGRRLSSIKADGLVVERWPVALKAGVRSRGGEPKNFQ